MYETTIINTGSQKVGWGTLLSEFKQDTDNEESKEIYMFDVNQKKWSENGLEAYGKVKSKKTLIFLFLLTLKLLFFEIEL